MFDMGGYDPMRKVWLVRLEFHEESLTWEILIPRGKFNMGDFDPTISHVKTFLMESQCPMPNFLHGIITSYVKLSS
jgi:hypothetical protein